MPLGAARAPIIRDKETPFSPDSISGLVAWYDADNVVESGGDISQLNDLSGNGNHATQATGSEQPTLTSDVNGNRIDFADANNEHFDLPDLISGSTNRSMFAFCEVAVSSVVFSGGPNNTGERWTFSDAAGDLRIEISGSGYTSSLAPSGEQFMGCVLDGSTLGDHTLHLGSSSETTTGAGTVDTGAGSFFIGEGSKQDEDPPVSMRELVFYNRALTSQEITDLRTYMEDRWT